MKYANKEMEELVVIVLGKQFMIKIMERFL